MKKDISLLVILAIIIIVLLVILLLPKPVQSPAQNNQPMAGIEVFSPKVNDVVSSPLKITGFVNGGGWVGFEGQVGIVKLFDASRKELALGILTAKGEWMQTKIDFETELQFISNEDSDGYLTFYNENPSGEPERNKTFTLPVKFAK